LLETTQFEIEDNLSMKLSALNVDFSSPSPDRRSRFKEACARGCQRGVPL